MKTAVAWCFASLRDGGPAAHADAGRTSCSPRCSSSSRTTPPTRPPRIGPRPATSAYLAMALGRLAGSGADRAAAIAKLPGLVTALRDLASDDVRPEAHAPGARPRRARPRRGAAVPGV